MLENEVTRKAGAKWTNDRKGIHLKEKIMENKKKFQKMNQNPLREPSGSIRK